MKRVITYTILLLSIILTTATAHSQSYPVQANLYVMAPYSQTYSDYYADGQQRMFVNVLLNDMSQGQLDVVLRFTISGNNLKLISKPNTTAKPITILSGKLCRIEGSELAQYLKPEQMQVEGRKADEFNKSGRLPEGYYEIKVEVVEFYRKVRISAPVYTTMWIMQPEAPVWTMPQNGVRLDATNPQFVMFGWMLTNSTSLLQNVKYTFSIYAKPDDINPDVVARTTTPLYSETLTQTMLVYGPDKPLLELGGTYVCRIKAEDADGNVTFKNDGYSETLVFRYGQTCDPPRQVTITDVTKKGATVNWVESGNYSGYDIEVRETTGGKSSDWYVWNIDKQVHSYDLKQLAVSSSYECRVAAVCGQRSNGIRSQYSDVVSFKTYDAGNKNYNCGDLVEANKHEDRVPYPYLEEGDVIEANGFLFAIESISKASEGVFSGQCSWYIDLWGVSILCDFKDISINRHQQLIAGKIEACRDKVKAKAFTRLQSAVYMPIGTQVPSTFTAEKVIKMEETVDSIRIVNGQTLIYVAGKEPQKVDATDDVFVQSPDGNYYAVEGGNVYPKPSNLDSEGNRQLSYTQQLVATFGYDDAMGSHPGVDSYTDAKAPFAAQYTQYQLHSNDAYATWMAVEKYRTSMAKVTVSGGDRDSIQLRSNGQLMVRTDAAEPDALYMPISTEGLYEAYYTTKDNKGKDVEVVAGQLNVTSYERNNINVCLVGVNGEFYQYSVSELSSYLNQVFGQAVTSINLTTASIEVDKFNGTLSAKESGALSAYNSDMKKLIRKVKKLSDYNDETYYIMLVERSDDQTLGGFMPVNSNFGFVFAKANSGKEQLNRTIAHELAHGAFRLWHTFSSENIYVAQRGSTKNLMDYNGTNAELFKYQWDYIHNPEEGIVKWMVDDEEGENISLTGKFYAILNGNENYKLYDKSSITILAGTDVDFEIAADEYMVNATILQYKKQGKSDIHIDSIKVREVSIKFMDSNSNEIQYSTLPQGKYSCEITVEKFECYERNEPKPIPKKIKPYKFAINISVVDQPIVRVEPADRENFFLKFGYDDALVEENQARGDYPKEIIDRQNYYVPWLHIQPNVEAEMKIEFNYDEVYVSKIVIPVKLIDYDYVAPDSRIAPPLKSVQETEISREYTLSFIVKGDDNIKINGKDSIEITLDRINDVMKISCNNTHNGFVSVYTKDLITGKLKLAGKLEVECRQMKTIGTIKVYSAKRYDEDKYPTINQDEILDFVNKYYVQAGVRFELDSSAVALFEIKTKSVKEKLNVISDFILANGSINNETQNFTKTKKCNLFLATDNHFIDEDGKHTSGQTNKGQGWSYVLLENKNYIVIVHELGHVLDLPHTFKQDRKDNLSNTIKDQSTINIMDYESTYTNHRKLFYKYQINHIYKTHNAKQ